MDMRASAVVLRCLLAFNLTVTQVSAQAASPADVDAYPERPVRMILASGPGSSPDIMLITGAEAVGSTPEEYNAWLQKDTDHWTKLLKQSGAKLGSPLR
jgi:tripartite-type tricarboxylate transporter receptor subunit TctC